MKMAGFCAMHALMVLSAVMLAPMQAAEAEAELKFELEAGANPMEKVIELLDALAKQIEKEGKDDAATYRDYTKFYQNQTQTNQAIVKENANKIAQLTSDLKEADAFRQGKQKELVDMANKLAKSSNELDAGKQGRAKDRAQFEKNEAVFIESLDQLQRALKVMGKKAPKAAAASSASLLSVAKKLKSTLTTDSDFTLSTGQIETLESFMRQAEESQEEDQQESAKAVPSFLQIRSKGSRGPYGAYQSKGGGLITTLQDLQGKVKKERDAALKAEKAAKKLHKEWEAGLTAMITNFKKSIADVKSAVAQSAQVSAQNQASLNEAKQIYKITNAYLTKLEAEFRGKTQAYKVRLGKRSDEAIAIHEAQRILSSEVAKSYIKAQRLGNAAAPAPAAAVAAAARKRYLKLAPKPLKFIQMSQEKRAAHHHLSLMALQATDSVKEGADPFKKVKNMIKNMLKKLKEKQAAEKRHAAWCDSEMAKTLKSQKSKGEDVLKMKNRLEALNAELTKANADITTVTKDMGDLSAALASAAVIREKERVQAVKSMKQYNDAAALLMRATKVLKNFYKKKALKGPKVTGARAKKFTQRSRAGAGIIGILEIAIDDFKKLYAETKEAEAAAVKDFKSSQNDGQVRIAVFKKDLEWKSRTKVKLELDKSTMTGDLKAYQKEKAAIDTYLAKLKASCIVKGPTYAERKAKREAELASLKEALTYLKGNR